MDTKSPVAEAIAGASRLWRACDSARLDTRIAERGGDATEIATAKAAENAAVSEWHKAYLIAQTAAKTVLAELGISAADFRGVL